MRIAPFGVEIWMNDHETRCDYNLAETCVASFDLGELCDIVGSRKSVADHMLATHLGYGDIHGSERLRAAIATLYTNVATDDIMTTHGTIGANMLVYKALIEPGDHVVSILPSYQQHYSIPESLGAEVSILRLDPETNFALDVEALRKLVTSATKLIALTNPNNPTGARLSTAQLEEVASIAGDVGAYVLCDEVYRGLIHGATSLSGMYGTSIADIYEKGISTGGLSKPYSLAGLRVGWVAGPKDVLNQIMVHCDYDTISVGPLNEYLAAVALENRASILQRAQQIIDTNLKVLTQWMDDEPLVSWVRPVAGTTTLLKYAIPLPSHDLCIQLLQQYGVMLTPGSAMDMEGWLRIGYANEVNAFRDGVARMAKFFAGYRA